LRLPDLLSDLVFFIWLRPPPRSPLFPYTTLFRSTNVALDFHLRRGDAAQALAAADRVFEHRFRTQQVMHTPLEPLVSVAESTDRDRKSTRLNSSHDQTSYAVFCLKKKTNIQSKVK